MDQNDIFSAVRSGDIRTFQRAVTEGLLELSARDDKGNSLLHLSADSGNLAITEELIEHGADINAKDRRGRTPLHLACGRGHTTIVDLLLSRNAIVTQDRGGYSPLHWASGNGQSEQVKKLVQFGADPNLRDRQKRTALHWAAQNDHTQIVIELLRSGADVNVKDKHGHTVLDTAILCGHDGIAQILRENKAIQSDFHAQQYTWRSLLFPATDPGRGSGRGKTRES
jgi:ankyrin repeat protein